MPLVCPHCRGNAFLMVTGSDGRTVTVCTECDNPVPFDPPSETGPGLEKPESGEAA
jgi:hypothetical protein